MSTTRWVIVGGAVAVVVVAKRRRRRRRSIEEVSAGSRPIEGVGTSVAAFVGPAPASPQP
jgi:hypothetical protein